MLIKNFKLLLIALAATLLLVASLPLMPSARAVVEIESLSTELLQQRYDSLIAELRCPKCQNQNLAGSDSLIAQDLRNEVRVMLEAGQSDQEIRDFMVARYGNFVLYDPPFSGVTLWVWVIPAFIFLLGVVAVVVAVRKAATGVDDDEVMDEDRLHSNSEDVD